jgi:glycerol kinase
MPGEFILSIDQGTTNTKALLVDRRGEAVFRASMTLGILQPQAGFVEQDPVEIWNSVVAVAMECARYAHESGAAIAGIAISNQRETALAWRPGSDENGETPAGKPIASAISWQCRRSSEICDRLAIHGAQIREKTGLPLDPLVTASKWAWLLEARPELVELAQQGQLCFGTVDTWLIANLTCGAVHATDTSNASRTALLNLQTLDWDDEMLGLFGVPRAVLPRILQSSGVFGFCAAIPELEGVPIVSAIGDSHAALVGHGQYGPGTVKTTYGTGSSLMTLTDGLATPVEMLARTVAWSTREGVQFALEGNIAMTGSAVQWVGEFLGLENPTADTAALAETVSDAGGVVFVPAMVGLGAPYWDKEARGTIANLERSHTAAHLARAALDSIAFQVADVLLAMETAAEIELPVLLVDGGASRNDTLMQLQANVLMRPVHRASNEELSAIGAAWLGGLAIGWWNSFEELTSLHKQATTFTPNISLEECDAQRKSWKLAVRRARLCREEAP